MMKYTHFLLIACCCLSFNVTAQTQHGLVIGINNYFRLQNGKQVPDETNSTLKGCVNDAKAIKQVLVSRFGFPAANIKELYDYAATEEQIRQEIKALLARCKKGDVAVFYFSGHGFSFPHIDPKTGTQWEEAICTADFSATQPYNYIQGTELAYWFGQFVDKGVTLTALFDCCHSNSTVRLKKNNSNLAGIRKVLDMSAWVQAPEEGVSMVEVITLPDDSSLLSSSAFRTAVPCDGKGNTESLNAWLQAHGGATAEADSSCPGALTWSYKEINTLHIECEEYRHLYQFTVRDACGRADSTSASFVIQDYDAPLLINPASDTTITCCGQQYQPAFERWLNRNAGARASDSCSLSWSNSATKNWKQTLDDLEATGKATVTFTATDGCQQVQTSATFYVEDQAAQEANRISEREGELILDLLNKFDLLNMLLSDMNIGKRAEYIPGRQTLIQEQLSRIGQFRLTLLPVKTDSVGLPLPGVPESLQKADLEAIQGTPQMAELVASIDSLLVLTDPLFLDQVFPWSRMAQTPVSMPPLDFLFPVTDTTDYAAYLDQAGDGMHKEMTLVTADPAQFPYTPYPFRPPSKIPGSAFLFMSATDDVQKGVEKKDENKTPRGAFTKALITVLRDGPASQSAVTIFQKVKQQLSERYIPHTPSMSIAEKRTSQNLFGVNPNKLTDKLTATCVKVKPDNVVILNKGSLMGLSPGNVMSYLDRDKRIDVEIIGVNQTESTGKIKPGFRQENFSIRSLMDTSTTLLNKTLVLTDNYTASKPLVRVYIPKDMCTPAQQLEVFEKYYRPLLQQDPDLIPLDSSSNNCSKIFMQGKGFTQVQLGKESAAPIPLEKLPATVQAMNDYFIYLPVRSDISEAVRGLCLKDQNIALVQSPDKSNLSFYCTYSRKTGGLVYVVTDQETTGKQRLSPRRPAPYYYFPATDPKTQKPLTAQQLSDQIYKTLLLYASRYGWINKVPKKK